MPASAGNAAPRNRVATIDRAQLDTVAQDSQPFAFVLDVDCLELLAVPALVRDADPGDAHKGDDTGAARAFAIAAKHPVAQKERRGTALVSGAASAAASSMVLDVATVASWGEKARQLKTEIAALGYACADSRTPWYAKVLAVCIVAYALSPIDLIPDPIPVVGYLDDLVLLPLGILLVVRWIPPAVMAECRERARAGALPRPVWRWVAAAVIVGVWLGTAVILGRWVWLQIGPGPA